MNCPRCAKPVGHFFEHGAYRDDGRGFCAGCGRTRNWHAGKSCFCIYSSGLPLSILFLDRALDAWLAVRVAAHQARGGAAATARAIDVPFYLRLLRTVRAIENVTEGWRSELGATTSRAFELVTTDEQLVLEVG